MFGHPRIRYNRKVLKNYSGRNLVKINEFVLKVEEIRKHILRMDKERQKEIRQGFALDIDDVNQEQDTHRRPHLYISVWVWFIFLWG